jgi:hypothetical protein
MRRSFGLVAARGLDKIDPLLARIAGDPALPELAKELFAVALCRCMNIPARYCTGYLGDIGVTPDQAPMDHRRQAADAGLFASKGHPSKHRGTTVSLAFVKDAESLIQLSNFEGVM